MTFKPVAVCDADRPEHAKPRRCKHAKRAQQSAGANSTGLSEPIAGELNTAGGEWQIYNWAPERIRRIQDKGAVKAFYTTLYGEKHIEAANAMYNLESDAEKLRASTFEP